MKNNNSSWNLKPLTKVNFSKQRKVTEKVHQAFINKWQKNNNWKSDPKTLKQTLDEYEKIQYYYANGSSEGYY